MLAVEERKNFVLRSVVVAAVVILIFSLFLNAYIIKPIRELNVFANQATPERKKINFSNKIENRDDEIGNLSRSLSDMTNTLYDRIDLAERFASDLTHEIRNPLASLKGASDLLNSTKEDTKRNKLLKIIANDVDRIERLITDYSQVLRDEAAQSRSVAKEFDLIPVIKSVIEDFNTDQKTLQKKISIIFKNTSKEKAAPIFGIESRIEQVIANVLENAVSFSPKNEKVELLISQKDKKVQIRVKDNGPGFDEKNLSKIFERFYSDRPDASSINHSGLGLNIVKNIIDSHKGSIEAYNFSKNSKSGAVIDIKLPLRN
jgi:two-component system sensor histidine kinase ChvG